MHNLPYDPSVPEIDTEPATSSSNRANSEPLRLVYITPAFPWVSHVFEQNEVVGLLDAGCEVLLLSCINPGPDEPVHAFARPLLKRTEHPSAGKIARGFGWCLRTRPFATLTTMISAVVAALTNPPRFRQQLGVWALAVCFAPMVAKYRTDWLHADFAQSSATVAWYLQELLGVPFSYKAHAYDIYSTKRSDREASRFFAAKTKAANLVFCVSEYGLNRLMGEARADLTNKSVIHRVGVRADAFEQLPPPESDQPTHFVALGRLVEKKGFDRLIEAAGQLRDKDHQFTLTIHGDGPLADELSRQIQQLKLEEYVTLAGVYQHEQLPELLQSATALIVPSIKARSGDMDGVPTVIYEAMALGRPVIASALSGIPEIIADGKTGWLVPAGDAAALSKALALTIADPARIASVVPAAREYVLKHHTHQYLGRTLAAEITKRLPQPSAGAASGQLADQPE